MKKIVVIGNSIAGVKALETIRGLDKETDLAMFTFDGFYPYQPELFADYFSHKIKENKIFYKPHEFYDQNKITLILQRQITRVNFKKKKVFTEQKDQIDFDFLIIADTNQTRLSDIKGTGKTGVFSLRMTEIKKILAALPFVETVAIEGNSPQSSCMAEALKEKGKEVILLNNELGEVLGDSDVKAVRLKSGKVVAAEIVLFTEAPVDLRMFADSELDIDQKILIDSSLRTNIEGVFAFPPAARFREQLFTGDLTSTIQQEEAGKTMAANICGQNVFFPIPHPDAELETCPVTGNSAANG